MKISDARLTSEGTEAVFSASSSSLAEYATFPAAIEFLGGEAMMQRRIDSKIDVHKLILSGFPNGVLTFLIRNLPDMKDPSFLQKATGMSRRTSQRKNVDQDVLTPEQSSKTWNFAEVMAQATSVFGSRDAALDWLKKPALALDGLVPIDLMATSAGHHMVKDLLGRFEYGVYT